MSLFTMVRNISSMKEIVSILILGFHIVVQV